MLSSSGRKTFRAFVLSLTQAVLVPTGVVVVVAEVVLDERAGRQRHDGEDDGQAQLDGSWAAHSGELRATPNLPQQRSPRHTVLGLAGSPRVPTCVHAD